MNTDTISIHLENEENSLRQVCPDGTTAEELCLKLCQYLKVAPITAPLFGLRSPENKLFFAPNTPLGGYHQLDFRIRYRVPTLSRLKILDPKAYNYYFHQVRNDIIKNSIPDIVYAKHKDHLLGLGITDMHRIKLEENKTIEELVKDYKKYISREILKKHSVFTKKPIYNTLVKFQNDGIQDAGFVKDKYLEQLNLMAPNYLLEEYEVQMDSDGSTYKVTLQVMPFHQEQPGLRIYYDNKKKWEHLCTINDLCFMSLRTDSTIEISRKNGIPIYLKFMSMAHMLSFVSACDGYYRLMIKWTFNLCKNVQSPLLQKLHTMRCHGPVGIFFSYQKLEEKGRNQPGMYILRQCEQHYDTFYLDVCTKNSTKPETYKIEKVKNSYILHDKVKQKFPDIPTMVASFKDPEEPIYLHQCLPPSDYDKSQLLICEELSVCGGVTNQALHDDVEQLVNTVRSPHCINTKNLLVFKQTRVEGSENFTVLYKALWNVNHDKKLEVAMKMLKHDTSDKYMKEFIDLTGQWAYLQSPAIVRLYGVTLRSPVSMIMEYLHYGPLDAYLRVRKKQMSLVELVEAASALATALWNLAENQIVHGNIRCRKVLVAYHDNNRFSVKLSEPGLHNSYKPYEVHWIPVEYLKHNMEDSARISPLADIWAFATTLWEIFSYGMSPTDVIPTLTSHDYLMGNRLRNPEGCPREIFEVMHSCWHPDPHQRLRPQVIMRDINHLLYQVFNSRRTHSYATVYPKSFKEPSLGTGSTINLIPQDDNSMELLPSSDVERVSTSSISSSFSGGHTTMTDDMEDYSHNLSIDVFSILGKIGGSSNSVDTIRCIFELEDSNIVLQGRIGQGFYGEVYRGTMERNADYEPVQVAIKKLKTTAQTSQLEDFEREISIMKTLKHRNIVEILGVVGEPEVQLVMEYLQNGCLESYLKTNRHTITQKQLLTFALDVARGMEYLDTMHVVHRDLAARNILVVNESHVKISDFGLAQVMNKEDYYLLKTNRDLPLKWYAPESISEGKFSSRSDVWSYGVTLWEMFSFGEEPPSFETKNPQSRVSKLSCPDFCPAEVYVKLLLPCWELNPMERPIFSLLATTAEDLLPQF